MKQFIQQITLDEMRDELQREIKMRQAVYPRWILSGKIDERTAAIRVLVLQACLAFIETELKKNHAQGDLFG
jgi:hypothetical protein